MSGKPLRPRYLEGTQVQYRDGHVKIKTADGMQPLSRVIAATNPNVINGGDELKKGWKVCHLDMSTYGTRDHDKPENLVVIKCRDTKFEFLKAAQILFEPKPQPKPIQILKKAVI